MNGEGEFIARIIGNSLLKSSFFLFYFIGISYLCYSYEITKENSPEYDFWITFQYLTRTGFAFIAPLIIIIYCYMSIYMFLRKRRKAQDGLIIQSQVQCKDFRLELK